MWNQIRAVTDPTPRATLLPIPRFPLNLGYWWNYGCDPRQTFLINPHKAAEVCKGSTTARVKPTGGEHPCGAVGGFGRVQEKKKGARWRWCSTESQRPKENSAQKHKCCDKQLVSRTSPVFRRRYKVFTVYAAWEEILTRHSAEREEIRRAAPLPRRNFSKEPTDSTRGEK